MTDGDKTNQNNVISFAIAASQSQIQMLRHFHAAEEVIWAKYGDKLLFNINICIHRPATVTSFCLILMYVFAGQQRLQAFI